MDKIHSDNLYLFIKFRNNQNDTMPFYIFNQEQNIEKKNL